MGNVSTRPQKSATPVAEPATTVTKPSTTVAAAVPVEDEADAVARVAASPTLLILQLKAKAAAFTANRVTNAQECGFEFAHSPHDLALLSYDLRQPLMTMKVHGGQEAFGKLAVIELHIDPARGPIEYEAGTRALKAAIKFAELMDGRLCDGLGAPLSEEACTALAAYVDDVMKVRRKEAREARPKWAAEDGTIFRQGDLSFMVECYSKRGAYIRSCDFNCEPAGFYEGRVQGLIMAREMLDFMRTHKATKVRVDRIVEDAFELIAKEPKNKDGRSRGNVLQGFMSAIQGMLEFAASHAQYQGWMDKKIEYQQGQAEWFANYEAQIKADFVARMKAAKAAKKAARQGGAA